MIAVLTVFANHLWNVPRGGFVGVDVFFVISGFLITGNLLRDAENHGRPSFTKFYWNRLRRIVPAATVVIVLTYLAALIVFVPFRAQEVGIDALWAFVFMSNWWFGYQGTDYFRVAADTVSPIQHYWSLSIEEQFYFVWPTLIFLISVYVVRKARTHEHRMRIAGYAMSGVVASSFAWAIYQTATSPAWAYFDTLARVWELGVGALLATVVTILARIPMTLRPWLSWGGIGLIGTSVLLVSADSGGFPAPWALLPVVGASLVIAAGVGVEPTHQAFLRNPVSGYIGDISYSLYLVHWPIIVILGSIMDATGLYYLAVVSSAFGLAIASYHFVEQPLRKANWAKARVTVRDIRKHRYHPQRVSSYAAIAALTLITAAMTAYAIRPEAYESSAPPPIAVAAPDNVDPSGPNPQPGPLSTALQEEIAAALQTAEWPQLDQSIESVINSGPIPPVVADCHNGPVANPQKCSWGLSTAPTQVVLVGDSIALGYSGLLREIALNSSGRIQVHSHAMGSCAFARELIERQPAPGNDCVARKQSAVDFINRIKPEVVIVANRYELAPVVGSPNALTPRELSASVRAIIEQFSSSAGKVVFLSTPPGDKDIKDCYGTRSSKPTDCIGRVNNVWNDIAFAERNLAGELGGLWIDARPWFCSASRLCPIFVGSTLSKWDEAHIAPAYGTKISAVVNEAFEAADVW